MSQLYTQRQEVVGDTLLNGGDREGKEEEEELVPRETNDVYDSQSAGNVYALGGSRDGKEKYHDGHVSETELLIAHVLAAMKDCTLSTQEIKPLLAPTPLLVSGPTLVQASSHVKASAWTSSHATMPAAWTSSHGSLKAAGWTSSQENAAARCITSLKHAHNKENSAPSNLNLDMQDERAHPKFRNVADLYKLSEI